MGHLTKKSWGAAYLNGRAIGFLITILLFWFVGVPLAERCSEMPGSPALQRGQKVMHQMAGRENLQQVGFFESHPAARPSDFVNMISDPDHELWPPTTAEEKASRMGAPPRSSNRVLIPDGLAFSPRERSTTESDEIVFLADDANGKLIVRGYSPGQEAPAFEYTWDFPTNASRVPL